ncbi:restriction endonuclease subunit S [Metallibacterium sp.]
MSRRRYPTYKDSGLPWLGSVPKHWALKPLWVMFNRVKKVGFEGEQLLSVYRDHGVVPKASRDDNNNKPSDDLSPYQLVCPGDLVINKMKAWQGAVAISDHRGIVSPAYFVYEARHEESGKYLHYLMRSPQYVAGYLSMSKGIRVNQWDLEPQYHSRLPVLLPPKEDQEQIVAFLDRETAKIDALIAEQEKLLALLAEKRQATISHAVTRGLNPNAPMKDSGILWLGEVPEHWEVRSISSVSTKITNGYVGPTRDLFVEDGIRYLQSLHIKENCIRFDPPYFVRQEWSDEHNKSILEVGDVLIVQTGDIGQSAVVTKDFAGCNCHALIIVAPLREQLDGRWLSWVLNSNFGVNSLLSIQTGALHPHLNCGNVKGLYVPLPPLKEQASIIEYIDDVGSRYEALSDDVVMGVNLLRERRSALISAAVTGKIDVRGEIATHDRAPILPHEEAVAK